MGDREGRSFALAMGGGTIGTVGLCAFGGVAAIMEFSQHKHESDESPMAERSEGKGVAAQ